VSRRQGEGRPAPDPPKRDDAGNPLPPDTPIPGTPAVAGTWGGEGGAGDDRGGPGRPDEGGGSEVM
jgi:hypothetical protein